MSVSVSVSVNVSKPMVQIQSEESKVELTVTICHCQCQTSGSLKIQPKNCHQLRVNWSELLSSSSDRHVVQFQNNTCTSHLVPEDSDADWYNETLQVTSPSPKTPLTVPNRNNIKYGKVFTILLEWITLQSRLSIACSNVAYQSIVWF